MSLLLDALKKAAEKKAKKSSPVDDSVESTDIADSQNAQAASQQDDTALTDTIALDHEPTQLNQETEFSEATEIDATSIDETLLTESTIIKAAADDHEPTQLDHETEFSEATEIDATSIDETLLTESTIIESAADDHEPAQLGQETEYSETIEMDAVSMDETVLTEVKALDQESVSDTSAKESEVAEMDSTSDDETEINDDDFDTALIDTISKGRDVTQFDQMDNTSLDNTEMKDDTEMEYQSQLSEEDRTLFIYDGADEEEDAGEETEAALSKTDAFFHYRHEDDNDGLTEEDVTQFMGDGVAKSDSSKSTFTSSDQLQSAVKVKSDDTTLTNPESLTMTNFSFSDHAADETVASEAVPLQDQTQQSDTFSLHEHDGRPVEDQTSTHSLYQGNVLDDDKSTRINTDSTSTISSVDIEKLTSDQTVTIGSKTSTKTFAPDNYDRTLLNLSQKDVSKIFPGMQSESDAVMTPDYAKRVFLSKSGQVKTHYYKLYAGIGLMLLLSVIMWGLFLLQEESDLIDQRLANLKRDPMPGIIKPQNENESQRLFLPDSKESNLKAVDIIAKAGELESTPVENEIADSEENQVDSSLPVQDELAEVTADTQDEEIAKTDNMQASSDVTPTTEIKSVQPTRTSAASTLSISTGSKISQKNKLLTEAFEAYEQSDLTTARMLYSEVLAMDESDRDGLLGRAAVHILDNEYQQAIHKYQQLLVDNPKDSMAMASLISVANIDAQSGETQLKKLLREQPESPYLHFALGNMYGSQNRWNEAQSSYFEAMQKRPDDPNYAYNLAVSLEHIGKPGTALTFYQKALENSSNGLVTFDEQLVRQRLEVLAQ